jgi:hypothetical protein
MVEISMALLNLAKKLNTIMIFHIDKFDLLKGYSADQDSLGTKS